MNDIFVETLHSWQNFYFMAGGAAAGLLGLMFVALSLGMNVISIDSVQNFSAFVTPSIFYFVSALLTACVMLVPVYTPPGLAFIAILGGSVGLARTLQHVRQLIQVARLNKDFNAADWLAQIILPISSYGLILLAAGGFGLDQWSLAFAALWLAEVSLLICAIANTWSLVIWIIDHAKST